MIKKVFCAIVALVLLALIGCSAMLDAITPAYIPPDLIKYADVKPTIWLPVTSLWDLQRVQRAAGLRYQVFAVKYGFMVSEARFHELAAKELQVKVIQPAITGLVGSGAFAFGWLGLKRPKDKSPEELKA